MKRPFTAIEDESADSASTAAPISNQVYLDENGSTFVSSFNHENENNDENGSESEDGLSDSSKKMRKKRNAYQKISDEIRVNLLDSVKNGETLKSAAKRYKINYSSAKSILHTYRKEGRILKKSAQERTTKKRSLLEVSRLLRHNQSLQRHQRKRMELLMRTTTRSLLKQFQRKSRLTSLLPTARK
jgi:transposase